MAVLLALQEEYTRARAAVAGCHFLQEFSQRTCAAMSRLNGPFAFLLYDSETQCLWFGRDVVGRRSLLTRTVMLEGCAAFCAASVASPLTIDAVAGALIPDSVGEDGGPYCSDESDCSQEQESSALSDNDSRWVEVPPSGMWLLQLGQLLHCTTAPQPLHFPWIISPHSQLPFATDNSAICTDAVLSCLETSVRARALVHSGSCGIGILFSGGLDCMIIAALAARCVAKNSIIDLFNVAFDAAEAPDRHSACAGLSFMEILLINFLSIYILTMFISGFIELCTLFPSIRWRLFVHDVDELGKAHYFHRFISRAPLITLFYRELTAQAAHNLPHSPLSYQHGSQHINSIVVCQLWCWHCLRMSSHQRWLSEITCIGSEK